MVGDVRTLIIEEAHATKYSVHPGQYEKNKMEKLPKLYVDETIARHGVHVSSIPDKDGMYIEVLEMDVEVVRLRLENVRDLALSEARRRLSFEVNMVMGGDYLKDKVSMIILFGNDRVEPLVKSRDEISKVRIRNSVHPWFESVGQFV
ncbi:hypothetical protein Tco_0607957 [Tanacetum coccineum]